MNKVKVKPLFTEAKKALDAYKEEVAKLDEQERELKGELNVLQEEMTANLLSQESSSVSEIVYLKIEAKEITQKADIIKVLLEELQEDRTNLKLKYVPILRNALGEADTSEYNANDIVERYRYKMLTEIADIGKQMQEQYREVAPDLQEVFQDSKVLERFPRLHYHYTYENYRPHFSWWNKNVVSKNDVHLACSGSLPQGLKKPQEGVDE